MKIAYLINQYPKGSHTFVRREIEALESIDSVSSVLRYSIRPTLETLADVADQRELGKTVVILDHGLFSLMYAVCQAALTRPARFLKALVLSLKLSCKGDRGLARHLIYLAEASWLQRQLVRESVGHLHAHFGTNSATVALLSFLLGGPKYSFTVHGPEEFDKPTVLGLTEKIHHASFVVAISQFGRSQLYRWSKFADWPKIHVVHCGLDREFFHATETQIPDNQRFVCVGRLCEQKGQLLLVAAFAGVLNSFPSAELVLVGDGPMRAQLEDRIRELGIERVVRITGWASGEAVRKEILESRVFVLPSFAEGLPVVIMEALAMDRPVISTFVAGIPELVRPGENGWLVPAGDVDALVNAMREVLETNKEQLQKMGQAGRERVLQRHNISTEVAKLAELILRSEAG